MAAALQPPSPAQRGKASAAADTAAAGGAGGGRRAAGGGRHRDNGGLQGGPGAGTEGAVPHPPPPTPLPLPQSTSTPKRTKLWGSSGRPGASRPAPVHPSGSRSGGRGGSRSAAFPLASFATVAVAAADFWDGTAAALGTAARRPPPAARCPPLAAQCPPPWQALPRATVGARRRPRATRRLLPSPRTRRTLVRVARPRRATQRGKARGSAPWAPLCL